MKRRDFLKLVPPAVVGAMVLPSIVASTPSITEELVEKPVQLGVSRGTQQHPVNTFFEAINEVSDRINFNTKHGYGNCVIVKPEFYRMYVEKLGVLA